MDFIRIVKEVQPRFFLMENVRGLLSASLRHRSINQRGKDYPALELDEMNGGALKDELYPKILYQLWEEFYNCHIHHKLY
ncbi:MAG: Modification methylase HaeIII [Cyanobacteriota bacterium]|jgi:site-specific DNA-cytosine methylase